MLEITLIGLLGIAALVLLHGASRGWKAVTKKSLLEIIVVGVIAVTGIFSMSMARAAGSSQATDKAPVFVNSEQSALIEAQANAATTAGMFGDTVTAWTKCAVKDDSGMTVIAGQTGVGSYVFSAYRKLTENRYAVYNNAGVATDKLTACT